MSYEHLFGAGEMAKQLKKSHDERDVLAESIFKKGAAIILNSNVFTNENEAALIVKESKSLAELVLQAKETDTSKAEFQIFFYVCLALTEVKGIINLPERSDLRVTETAELLYPLFIQCNELTSKKAAEFCNTMMVSVINRLAASAGVDPNSMKVNYEDGKPLLTFKNDAYLDAQNRESNKYLDVLLKYNPFCIVGEKPNDIKPYTKLSRALVVAKISGEVAKEIPERLKSFDNYRKFVMRGLNALAGDYAIDLEGLEIDADGLMMLDLWQIAKL